MSKTFNNPSKDTVYYKSLLPTTTRFRTFDDLNISRNDDIPNRHEEGVLVCRSVHDYFVILS